MKSMLGESLAVATVTMSGIEGDRAFALRRTDGALVSAKRVKEMFGFHARLSSSGVVGIEFPNGRLIAWGDPGIDAALSDALGFEVQLVERGDAGIERIAMGETSDTTEGEGEFHTATGFFDSTEMHLLSTRSLRAARSLYPEGDWDPLRFRPNILIDTGPGSAFDIEEWSGRLVGVGGDAIFEIVKGCTRCVMTTHPQEGLPQDRHVLETLARHNRNTLGALARVAEQGAISVGDPVWLED